MKVEIEKIVHGGYGLARTREEGVVLTPFTLPGEEAEVEITHNRDSSPKFAVLRKILLGSAERIAPRCPVFGRCGGCQFQHMSVAAQRQAKQGILTDCLERIARTKSIPISWAYSDDNGFSYRNNVQIRRSRSGGVGFYAPFSNDVIEISSCPVAAPEINRAIEKLNEKSPLPREIEEVQLRSTPDGKVYIRVSMTKQLDSEQMREFQEGLDVAGILFEIDDSGTHSSWIGEKEMYFEFRGQRFRVSLDAFFQVNYRSLEGMSDLLENVIGTMEGLHGSRPRYALDLYGGGGIFSILNLKNHFEFVILSESQVSAVNDALFNLETNSIDNVSVWDRTVEETLAEVSRENPDDYFVLLDPPRAGLSEIACGLIRGWRPSRIVYISCEPSTLARDIRLMEEEYEPTHIFCFDQFPQTGHMETMTIMRGKR